MTEPNRQSGENEERIIEIEIERLRPFKEHPFQVKDDKEMFILQESIEKYGVYTGSPIHFPGTENKEIKPGEKADWNKNERDHG